MMAGNSWSWLCKNHNDTKDHWGLVPPGPSKTKDNKDQGVQSLNAKSNGSYRGDAALWEGGWPAVADVFSGHKGERDY